MALMQKAAEQGHAYAMNSLGCAHFQRNEFELAVRWFTKGAEAGLPDAMLNLGQLLNAGKGVAAPDLKAAAGWYRLAADTDTGEFSAPCTVSAVGKAAQKLCTMYTLGLGRARHIMPASSCLLILDPRSLG